MRQFAFIIAIKIFDLVTALVNRKERRSASRNAGRDSRRVRKT